MKASVIDLGFNSVKMVSYDVKKDGSFRSYRQASAKVKLGEGMHKTGQLGKEPARRTIEALKLFHDIIGFDSIKHVVPVATSAVRDADNRDDFLKEVRSQTGFTFRVLSGTEEAFYSYVGALQSTCIPTALFFDIGGGSLELVYTENFAIKKVKSYPLGALRLSQMFDGQSKKSYGRMEEHIMKVLPDKKELGLSVDTVLVGVGGALRAVARYDQDLERYGLDKIHNYRMSLRAVSSIAKELSGLDPDELAGVKAVGSNRADTIVAGSAVISLLMRKLDFDRVVVSVRGLREGILSVFARDRRAYHSGGINNEKAKAYVTFACQQEMLPQCTFTLVRPLVASRLLREKEKAILTYAVKEMSDLPQVETASSLFYMVMDEDSVLTHREQLILALSLVHSRKEKAAEWQFARYRSILEPQNMKSVKKVSALLGLSAILEKSKTTARVSIDGERVTIKLAPARQLPPALLANALGNFEKAFGVSVACQVTEKGKDIGVIV